MDFSARSLQRAAENGFKRTRNFRANRLRFIKAFVGQYYDSDHGKFGAEPLNMAFNAVRVIVPNLVTRNPVNVVDTDYLIYREYGELIALALNYLSKKMRVTEVLQRGIVDAIFTIGIFKVGLSTTDSLVYFGEEAVDPGKLYLETVDLDDFTFDPSTRYLTQASFLGERIRVERDMLLASGEFDNEVVERLPSSANIELHTQKEVRNISTSQLNRHQLEKLHDYVDLLELWLPGSNVIVTLPYKSTDTTQFLREESYYGPEEGPYSFLSLTPDVPGNPLPVALAGIWHDLHVVSNRIAKKMMDQAEAQKNILTYKSDSADETQEIVNAKNLAVVKMDDPTGAQLFSIGGQDSKNERMIAQLELWFNQMSGNTNLTGGLGMQAESATEANILSQNASTGVTFMRDMVYKTTSDIMRKCAWYLHTDPLINLPLIQRESIPAEYEITPDSIRMIAPSRVQETQVFLTPEVRSGDFLDFAFNIEQESMAPVNWQLRLQHLEMLAVRIIPAAAQAGMVAAQMGSPFSFQGFVTRAAKLMNMDWIDEIFQSPDLVAQLMAVAQRGPQPQNSKGVASMTQNNGAPVGKVTPSGGTQQRQEAQSGSASQQGDLPLRMMQ